MHSTFVKYSNTVLLFAFVIVLLGSCTPKTGQVIQEDEQTQIDKALEKEMAEKEREEQQMEAEKEIPIKDIPIKEVPTEEIITGPYLVASLAKTPCYGRCPVFEVRIYSDGVVDFFGEKNVNLIGHYRAKADANFIDQVIQEASKAGYYQLDSFYPAGGQRIPDLPNVITYVRIANDEKSVTNNHLAPKSLMAFEQRLEALINTLRYARVGE